MTDLRAFINMVLASRRNTLIAALILVTLIIISRKPILLVEPRFWWDEGSIHFSYAFRHSAWETFTAVHQGYYSLINNVSFLIQKLFFSVRNAPFVSTYMAFGVLLLPHAIVWGGKCKYWDTPAKRLLTSAIILFDSLSCALWLNVVTSQFHLSVVAFLILVEEWQGRSKRCIWTYAGLVMLAGLSGVTSCFLTPLFVLRWWRERSAESRVIAGAMTVACGIAFVGVLMFHFLHLSMFLNEHRYLVDMRTIFSKFLTGVMANIFIPSTTNERLEQIVRGKLLLGYIVMICGLVYFAKGLQKEGKIYFLGGFFLLSILNLSTSLNFTGHVRYFYAPNVILFLMVQQSLYVTAKESLRRKAIAAVVLALGLLPGAHSFYYSYHCYNPYWPKWTDEVATWRKNRSYKLQQHPRNHQIDWSVDLSPQK